jgi:hypothetical protein
LALRHNDDSPSHTDDDDDDGMFGERERLDKAAMIFRMTMTMTIQVAKIILKMCVV